MLDFRAALPQGDNLVQFLFPLRLPAVGTTTRKGVLDTVLDALPVSINSGSSSHRDKKGWAHPRTVQPWDSCEDVGNMVQMGCAALRME